VPHAAALSSGTAAIHLALRLVGVGPGDLVLCSSLTFVASVNPIVYQGATPVLIDSEPGTWNMSPRALERALRELTAAGRKPKAVEVVHLYGQAADLDPIIALCEKYGVTLIEDAAESLGATYKGRMTGSIAAIGAYSFNGNKIITTSGGGMLVAHDGALVERARKLSTQAREPAPHYEHTEVGYNYRLSNLLAAVGRGQLTTLGERIARRREIREHYREALAARPGIAFAPTDDEGNAWLTCITVDPEQAGVDREGVRLHLEAQDIESRPLWKPMHLQPVFRHCPARVDGTSEQLFAVGLCLPSGSSMSPDDQDRVIAALHDALAT